MVKQFGYIVGFTVVSTAFAGSPSALDSIQGQEVLNYISPASISLVNAHDGESGRMGVIPDTSYSESPSMSEAPMYPPSTGRGEVDHKY